MLIDWFVNVVVVAVTYLIVRAVYEVLAVERDVRIVVDLVDALVELLLDRQTIVVRVRVVRRVDDLLLEGLQDVDRARNSAFSNLHHAVAVLRVLVVLVERTDLDAHTLGNRIARSVIDSAVDLHAGRNLLEVRCERALILVQRVQRVDRHHVVLNYQCHFSFPPWFLPFSLLSGILVRPSSDFRRPAPLGANKQNRRFRLCCTMPLASPCNESAENRLTADLLVSGKPSCLCSISLSAGCSFFLSVF